jgi:diacylglycerol kinase family enzyme
VTKPLPVVINGTAGSLQNGSARNTLQQLFSDAGVTIDLHQPTPDRLPGVLSELVKSKPEVIVVGGGDGTLSTAADILADSGVTLGILPLGTFNHFARDLNIPLDLTGAIAIIGAGHRKQIDIGEINGRVFINNATMGFYPYAVSQREQTRQQLGISKIPAMGLALLGIIWRLPVFRLQLEMKNNLELINTSFLLLGNNRYQAEPLGTVRRFSLDQGGLSIFYTRRARRLDLFIVVLRLLIGRLQKSPELNEQWTEQIDIILRRRHKRLKIALDGEVTVMSSPLSARIRRQALRVIAPPDKPPD